MIVTSSDSTVIKKEVYNSCLSSLGTCLCSAACELVMLVLLDFGSCFLSLSRWFLEAKPILGGQVPLCKCLGCPQQDLKRGMLYLPPSFVVHSSLRKCGFSLLQMLWRGLRTVLKKWQRALACCHWAWLMWLLAVLPSSLCDCRVAPTASLKHKHQVCLSRVGTRQFLTRNILKQHWCKGTFCPLKAFGWGHEELQYVARKGGALCVCSRLISFHRWCFNWLQSAVRLHGFQRRWLLGGEKGGKKSISSITALQFVTLRVWVRKDQ